MKILTILKSIVGLIIFFSLNSFQKEKNDNSVNSFTKLKEYCEESPEEFLESYYKYSWYNIKNHGKYRPLVDYYLNKTNSLTKYHLTFKAEIVLATFFILILSVWIAFMVYTFLKKTTTTTQFKKRNIIFVSITTGTFCIFLLAIALTILTYPFANKLRKSNDNLSCGSYKILNYLINGSEEGTQLRWIGATSLSSIFQEVITALNNYHEGEDSFVFIDTEETLESFKTKMNELFLTIPPEVSVSDYDSPLKWYDYYYLGPYTDEVDDSDFGRQFKALNQTLNEFYFDIKTIQNFTSYIVTNYDKYVSDFTKFKEKAEKIIDIQKSYTKEILDRAISHHNFIKSCIQYFYITSYVFIICLALFIVFIAFLSFRKDSTKDIIIYIFLNILMGSVLFYFASGIIFKILAKSSNNYLGFFEYIFSKENLESENPLFFTKNDSEILNICLNGEGSLEKYFGFKTKDVKERIKNLESLVGLTNITVELNKVYPTYFDDMTHFENPDDNWVYKANNGWIYNTFPGFDSSFSFFADIHNVIEQLGMYTNLDYLPFSLQNPRAKTKFYDSWVADTSLCLPLTIYITPSNETNGDGHYCLCILDWTVEEVRERYKNGRFLLFLSGGDIGDEFMKYKNIVDEYLLITEVIWEDQVNVIQKDVSQTRQSYYEQLIKNIKISKDLSEGMTSLHKQYSYDGKTFGEVSCSSLQNYINVLFWELESEFHDNAEDCFKLILISCILCLLFLFIFAYAIYPLDLFLESQGKSEDKKKKIEQVYSNLKQESTFTIAPIQIGIESSLNLEKKEKPEKKILEKATPESSIK